MLISSLQNSRIKDVVRLNKRKQRDAQKQSFVEGVRECSRALAAGVVPLEAYYCRELLQGSEAVKIVQELSELSRKGMTDLFEVTAPVFSKMAYRGGSGGVLLVISYQEMNIEAILDNETPFIVVIDGAEKPGNLGAVLRSADAAGIDGLILSENAQGGTDIHNPNTIRASLGAYFTVPTISLPAEMAIKRVKETNLKVVATSPDAERIYSDVDLTGGVALVMGSEASGLGVEWLAAADLSVRIPMFGVVDSLNLSVSTALLLYEVVRQRKKA